MAENDAIRQAITERFARVAQHGPQGYFAYPSGAEALHSLGYPQDLLALLPARVLEAYCGIGNVLNPAHLRHGESVLDMGCGAGVDSMLAALQVAAMPAASAGEALGTVYGVDLSTAMLTVAQQGAAAAGIANVHFQVTDGVTLPFATDSFDVLISNGVFNLLQHKETSLREMLRVLKHGGRLIMADQVRLPALHSLSPLPSAENGHAASAAQWAT